MVAHIRIIFGVEASWSWVEKGHGKGPCDGVGGAVKKLADNHIKTTKITLQKVSTVKYISGHRCYDPVEDGGGKGSSKVNN